MLNDYRGAVADAEEAVRRKKPTTADMMHTLACIYALAAGRVKADTRETRRQTLEASYRQQALAALRDALPLLPRRERLAFWQEKMRPDAALDPIRDSPEF